MPSEMDVHDSGERYWTRSARRRLTASILVAFDLLSLLAASLGAVLVRFGSLRTHLVLPAPMHDIPYVSIALLVSASWPALLVVERLYDAELLFWGSGEIRRSMQAMTLAALSTTAVSFMLKTNDLSRQWLALTWSLSLVGVPVGRMLCRRLLGVLRSRGPLKRPTLLIGSNADAARLVDVISKNRRLGMVLVGHITRVGRQPLDPDLRVPHLGDICQLQEVIDATGADSIVIVSTDLQHQEISAIISDLRTQDIDITISSGLFEVLSSRVAVREMGGVPMVVIRRAVLSRLSRWAKRAMDVSISLVCILGGMPFWLLIAAAIVLDDPGPVFYRQERLGVAGTTFKMLKFRSMRVDADRLIHELLPLNEADGPLFKIKGDPRVTRLGRWMRKYSIDEFPQLVNVLLGDMSLVGPRPPLQRETEVYDSHHWKRLAIPPGMTGLWQVSGRSDLSFEEMVRLDLFYIENWSLMFDLSILARTIPAALAGDGAY